MLVDRAVEAPVIMASTAGGMEIEEVAHTNPELMILREAVRCRRPVCSRIKCASSRSVWD